MSEDEDWPTFDDRGFVGRRRLGPIMSVYEAALIPSDFAGRLEGYDSYDGEENWAGRTWSIHLDEPRGQIVIVELEDVFQKLEGKRVRLRLEVIE